MNKMNRHAKLHFWFTIFWAVMIPVSFITGWVHSVVFVSALSLWALVSGHWSAYEGATPTEEA